MPPPSLKALAAKILWVGIDPGMTGAIAALNEKGEFLWVLDMPITKMGREGEFRVEVIASVARQVERKPGSRVALEWPTTRPDESAESSKRFGVGLGMLEMAFTMAGARPVRVAPNKWKGRLGLKGKAADPKAAREDAVRMALEFIPGIPPDALRGPRGAPKDGRAEALLIAWEALTGTVEGLRALPDSLRLARVVCGSGRRRTSRGIVL